MKMFEILWKNIMDEVETKVSMIVFDTYFKCIKPTDLKEETIYLSVPTEIVADTLSTRFHETLLDAFKNTQSGIKNYSISVAGKKAIYNSDEDEDLSSPIDPNYTFENFVVGESNRYLYAAAKAVSANPGTTYNPLYIYGDTGLGKTHIMHAIANQIKSDNPEKNVLYATCEKFTTDLISKIRSGRAYEGAENFRDKYRKVDVLIIDDIQFLAKKQSTQEEFFHTFNELYGQNKQIILSSDVRPSEIETLTERLRTRFEGGLMAQVIAPDIETKIAILQKKGESKKAIISYEVANFIAENSSNDIRSLEGLLNKVIFASLLHEKPITLELAKLAIKQSSTIDPTDTLTAEDIIDEVCRFFAITKQDLLGKKKNKEYVEPRMICTYLITEMLSLPLVAIGKKMGGRDHTTVMHSRDKIAELIKTNTRIYTAVNDIKNLILKK
jgi:chromosomal replication initiator protein